MNIRSRYPNFLKAWDDIYESKLQWMLEAEREGHADVELAYIYTHIEYKHPDPWCRFGINLLWDELEPGTDFKKIDREVNFILLIKNGELQFINKEGGWRLSNEFEFISDDWEEEENIEGLKIEESLIKGMINDMFLNNPEIFINYSQKDFEMLIDKGYLDISQFDDDLKNIYYEANESEYVLTDELRELFVF